MNDDDEWWSAFGSLPAQLGPADLPKLNMGLRYLFNELTKAQAINAAGDHYSGSYGALSAAISFISLFRPNSELGLCVPLHGLAHALADLEEGIVGPILKPAQRAKTGRPRAPKMDAAFKGAVAFTVQRLCDFGYSVTGAHAKVAETLRREGVRPGRGSGRMTNRTVRGWCEEVDVDRNSEAARRRNQLADDPRNAQFDDLPPDEAAKLLLSQLCIVGRAFGQIKPANPPC